MWVKKSEWESMKDRLSVLEGVVLDSALPKVKTLGTQVDSLMKHHAIVRPDYFTSLSAPPVALCSGHNPTTLACDTENIEKVSFKELARYVLDGVPIKRKQEIEVEYI